MSPKPPPQRDFGEWRHVMLLLGNGPAAPFIRSTLRAILTAARAKREQGGVHPFPHLCKRTEALWRRRRCLHTLSISILAAKCCSNARCIIGGTLKHIVWERLCGRAWPVCLMHPRDYDWVTFSLALLSRTGAWKSALGADAIDSAPSSSSSSGWE